MSLQTPAKGVQWWRWCDLRWQTVPDLGTSNRKGSVANGGPVVLWLDEAASVGRAEMILLASSLTVWRRQSGRPHITWLSRNTTTLHSTKQQIWLRTALCGGWCRRMALRNLKPDTHWQQSWIQHGRICWTGNKSATKLNVFCWTFNFFAGLFGNNLNTHKSCDDPVTSHKSINFKVLQSVQPNSGAMLTVA